MQRPPAGGGLCCFFKDAKMTTDAIQLEIIAMERRRKLYSMIGILLMVTGASRFLKKLPTPRWNGSGMNLS